MKSNYKALGSYIREVNVKNKDLAIDKLLGVSITKQFIPSIANIIGTDMSTYKIVRTNQFAYGPVTSRNGDRISVALLQEEDCIVSTSYTVFEVTNTYKLLPEYLMMWFRRHEFDRYARYMSHGSVREMFSWQEMCEVMLPVPHIDEQREIVKEYNSIVYRIKLNEQLSQKLEETAQTIYKQWFADFEFPDENRQPYRSSGGEMEYNVKLEQEIPKNWYAGNLDDIAELIDGDRGKNYPSQGEISGNGYCLFLNAGNVTYKGFEFANNNFISKERDALLRKGKLNRNDIVITTRGTVGNVAFYNDDIEYSNVRINSGMVIIRAKKQVELSHFIYSLMRNDYMRLTINNFISGSAQPQLPIKDIKRMPIIIPESSVILSFSKLIYPIQRKIDTLNKQIRRLEDFKNVLLSKISKIEVSEPSLI